MFAERSWNPLCGHDRSVDSVFVFERRVVGVGTLSSYVLCGTEVIGPALVSQ